ncbi:MAG: DUF302 domain-containing protein [Betaproteobacteria bacterium]|nr:DUF302 domain-containing protein [Betaproteobacteria bacterium]
MKKLLFVCLFSLGLPAFAQQYGNFLPALPQFQVPQLSLPQLGILPATNPWMQFAPAPTFGVNPLFQLLAPTPAPLKPYTMRREIAQSEKVQIMQMMVPMMTNIMRMSMPDAMNYFARKYKVKQGVSFDEVRESLFLRANQLNMKKVGENLMYKDFQAVLGDKDAPRIEVYSFCDIQVGRDLLKISPEFVVFLPCRVVIMEDGDKNIWVMMLDWNLDWISGYEKQMGLTDELIKGAIDLNKRMDEMMRAAANGDI